LSVLDITNVKPMDDVYTAASKGKSDLTYMQAWRANPDYKKQLDEKLQQKQDYLSD
jgi:hypothetical protein